MFTTGKTKQMNNTIFEKKPKQKMFRFKLQNVLNFIIQEEGVELNVFQLKKHEDFLKELLS